MEDDVQVCVIESNVMILVPKLESFSCKSLAVSPWTRSLSLDQPQDEYTWFSAADHRDFSGLALCLVWTHNLIFLSCITLTAHVKSNNDRNRLYGDKSCSQGDSVERIESGSHVVGEGKLEKET